MGNSSSSSSIQSYLHDKENQEQFIASMNSTSPLFSDSLKNSSIVRSQANSVNYFCFFTCGSNRSLKFWQLRNFFVISLQVKYPKIREFHAIVHTYQDAKFLSTYIDKVAYANMISFMDNSTASISRDLYITRILDLYKNNDSLLYSKVYPLYRIRTPEPNLDIAQPTLIGRSAHRYAQDESFSSTTSEHPSQLAVNSEFLQIPSTVYETDSLSNPNIRSRKSGQKINENISAPELKNRSFDAWSTVTNDTNTFLDSNSETNLSQSKTSKKRDVDNTNNFNDFSTSSCLDPLSEPDSIDKSGLSTVLNSSYSAHDSSVSNQEKFSSSIPTISEPGLYESSISQTFKEARKMRSKVRLHKHHNLDSRSKSNRNNDIEDLSSSSSKVTVSESFFSPSTVIGSENGSSRISRSSRSSSRSRKRRERNEYEEDESNDEDNRRKRRRRRGGDEDDDSNYSISYSDRSVAAKAAKIHIFRDKNNSSGAPSFVSEAIISSTTGQPSRKRRNVGIEIDLHHDVGFTSSEKPRQSYEYEQSERSGSSSSSLSRRSSRSRNGTRNRRKRDTNYDNDNVYDQDDNLNRIRNRKKDISMDLSKSESMIDSD